MITIKQIARMCGVSSATVSNILNGKRNVSESTKLRVLEVVNQTGYQPNYFAQGIRKRKTNVIGILAEDLNQFSSPPIIEGIMACCEDMNYRTILINMRLYDRWRNTWYDDDKKLKSVLNPAIKELRSIKVDGMMYVAGHGRVINCFPDDFDVPAMVVYAYSKSPKFTSIVIDDEKGGYDVTRYLISMGHRKIGVIAGIAGNLHTQKRCEGYQRALFEDQILYNPDWIRYGDWERESGYQQADKLVNEGVTAIFCMNDNMAAGVYDYLEEHNMKAGEDISVVGYDNKEISQYLKPGLTTNGIPLVGIGRKSAEIMIDSLTQDSDNAKQKIVKAPCRLIERNSVKKIGQNR